MSQRRATIQWASHLKEVILALGQKLNFETKTEFQIDPQVEFDSDESIKFYTESRQIDIVWFKLADNMRRDIEKFYPGLARNVHVAWEIEASYDTKRISQTVQNLDKVSARHGIVLIQLSSDFAKGPRNYDDTRAAVHLARLRVSTPISVFSDVDVWNLYNIIEPQWRTTRTDALRKYVDFLRRSYPTLNQTYQHRLKRLWEEEIERKNPSHSVKRQINSEILSIF